MSEACKRRTVVPIDGSRREKADDLYIETAYVLSLQNAFIVLNWHFVLESGGLVKNTTEAHFPASEPPTIYQC